MFYIYNFLIHLILPLLPLRLVWKSRKNPSYRMRMLERFGLNNFPVINDSIWVHAVSLGEAISAIPLIKELMATYPNTKLVVTNMTPTGAQRIREIFASNAQILQLYVPYDYPFAIKRFLHHLHPKILILMEAELWPNILHYTAKQNIPILIANACLSAKSAKNYQKFARLIKPMLKYLTCVTAQSKLDAENFAAIGVAKEKILITGNIKFDIQINAAIYAQAKQLRNFWGQNRPIWVAASTHAGEEEKILSAAKLILAQLPNSLLILIPRHPERFNQVFALCKKTQLNTVRYSANQEYSPATNIVLGDVMGQLLLFYAAGDIAFVGGSLIPWGGHNLLEPAALAKPVLSGPNLSEFKEISQLMSDTGGLIKVANEIMLADAVIKLFNNKKLCEKIGCAALAVVERHRGATQKILAQIKKLIQ
jgi:3-deoxy-D-manno-octulosonic-acid transferase